MRSADTYRGARRNKLREVRNVREWRDTFGIMPGVYRRKKRNAAKLKQPKLRVPTPVPALLVGPMRRAGIA